MLLAACRSRAEAAKNEEKERQKGPRKLQNPLVWIDLEMTGKCAPFIRHTLLTHVYTSLTKIYTCIHIKTRSHTPTYNKLNIHTHTYIHTYIRTHTHTHTHVHTYTHNLSYGQDWTSKMTR